MPGKPLHLSLLAWFDLHGRKNLPWQHHRTPYSVWVSEIMLQQTQVSTVIPYYQRFMQRFPSIQSLAAANVDEVMHLWTGLGYYSRARNLHRAAQSITQDLDGNLPDTLDGLQQLPGIGRSTAAAILAQAFHRKATILDGNVKRVLTRLHAITEWPNEKATEARLWKIAEQLTPTHRIADYTQAIMDLGATVCTRSKPNCHACPFNRHCAAHQQGIAHTLPTKKPRRPLPIKTTTLLLLQHQNTILLQKRPARGIWSSLWSLPELEGKSSNHTIQQYCQHTLTIKTRQPVSIQTFRHTFTHFHLDIHPTILQCQSPRPLDSDQEIWYKLQHPQPIGLPAPIKKLLESLPCPE